MNNIDSLYMFILGEEGDNEIELSKDATSYTFPSGLLQPNTEYELILEAETTDGRENDLSTNRVIRFTTGSE